MDHGVVICKLCNRNMKENNFTGHGYRQEISAWAPIALLVDAWSLRAELAPSAGLAGRLGWFGHGGLLR